MFVNLLLRPRHIASPARPPRNETPGDAGRGEGFDPGLPLRSGLAARHRSTEPSFEDTLPAWHLPTLRD